MQKHGFSSTSEGMAQKILSDKEEKIYCFQSAVFINHFPHIF